MSRPKLVTSVSVSYVRNGSSTMANALGMRPMPERNDEVLEHLFELYTKMIAAQPQARKGT